MTLRTRIDERWTRRLRHTTPSDSSAVGARSEGAARERHRNRAGRRPRRGGARDSHDRRLSPARPGVAPRPTTGRMQREQDLADLFIADGRRDTDTSGLRCRGMRRTVFGSSPSWAAIRLFGRPSPRNRRTSLTSIIVTSRYIHASWPRARPRTGRPLSRGQARGGSGQAKGGKGFEKNRQESVPTF